MAKAIEEERQKGYDTARALQEAQAQLRIRERELQSVRGQLSAALAEKDKLAEAMREAEKATHVAQWDFSDAKHIAETK